MKRYWKDHTTRDFTQLDMERVVAVLPIGAIEQHGPHLPVSVDSEIVNGVVARTAEKLPEDSNVLFLPTLPFGKSDEHSLFAGTLTLSAQTLINVWVEIGASVAKSGVKKFVLLNSHGGQIAAMDIVTRELRIKHNMFAFGVNWFGVGVPPELYDDGELKHGIHAGDMETSVMLALSPDNVNMSQAKNFSVLTQEFEEKYKYIGLSSGAKPGWQIQDMNASGACGNAAAATVEKGETTLEYASDKLVDVLSEIDAAPLSHLSQNVDWPAR